YAVGGVIDWRRWQRERSGVDNLPKLVQCPLYPFQTDRHWFKPGINKESTTQVNLAVGHPLLGQKLDIAGTSSHRFANILSVEQPSFIDQHRVFGRPVLPAAAIIEWVLAGLLKTDIQPAFGWVLQQIEFHRAMIIDEESHKTVQLAVEEKNGNYHIRCFSRDAESANGSWTEHAEMQAQRLSTPTNVKNVSVEELQKSLTQKSVEECYEHWQQRGLNYGPAFRGMRALWQRGNQALARIESAVSSNDAQTYWMHPVILDACFHTLFAFTGTEAEDTVLLPVRIEQLITHRRLPTQLWCRAIWHGEHAHGNYSADLELLTESGESVVSIHGLHLAMVPRSVFKSVIDDMRLDGYETRWMPMVVEAHQSKQHHAAAPTAQWLIHCADVEYAKELLAQFAALGYPALAIVADTCFKRISSSIIGIDPYSDSDIEQLFTTLMHEHSRVGGLLFFEGGDTDPGSMMNVIDQTYKLAQTSFHFLQRFLAAYANASPEVVICSRGACVIEQHNNAAGRMTDAGLIQSVLNGMTKAVIAEYPHVKCVQVDLDPDAALPSMQTLLSGIAQIPGAGHIALRGNQWYEARLQICELLGKTLHNPVIRPDASYLITGGLGGIGRSVAEWLVNNGARSLILVGRSVPAHSTELIQLLERSGAQVTLMQTDLADDAAWETIRPQLENFQPPLRGIVHAAGVIDDGVMNQLDWQRFANVMAVKVRGAWHLHQMAEGLSLDFFSCFSSLTALTGSAGQSNYIVANSFLDS
ncbi:MAG: SDR family NAD(P)-dependent oxidoreductase, partial [Burkholderiaceae bacterium]